jgi:hypothetical protein
VNEVFDMVRKLVLSLYLCVVAILVNAAFASTVEAGCVSHQEWADDDRPTVIPVYVMDDAVYGLNSDSIGLERDRATVQILAGLQAWNDAGGGAPRLVFGGYVTTSQCMESCGPDSVLIYSVDGDVIDNFAGFASSVDFDAREYRIRISRDKKWVIDPGLAQSGSGSDLQAVVVHELGHVLGLGHPWLSTTVDTEVPLARASACKIGGAAQDVPNGTTVAVMNYFSRLAEDDGFAKYPRAGAGRYPWRDDVETLTAAAGLIESDGAQQCRVTDDCTQCSSNRPDCYVDALTCLLLDEEENVICDAHDDCSSGYACERAVTGIKGTGSGLELCESDAACNEPDTPAEEYAQSCDVDSGKCFVKTGRCVQRGCVVTESRAYSVGVWTHDGADWDGPTLIATNTGTASSTMPIAVSAADSYDSRRVTVVTVNEQRNVEYHQALDGNWCSEIDDHVVLPGLDGRTWARPVVAVGGGKTMVAWLTEEYREFTTGLRFAVRDSAGSGWDFHGSLGLPGYTKAFALGYAPSEAKFALTYIDEDMQARVRLIDPSDGSAGSPQIVVRTFIGTEVDFPIDDITRAACSDDRCTIGLADGNEAFYHVDGEWDDGEFKADDFGIPTIHAGIRPIGLAQTARRGKEDAKTKWYNYVQATPLEAGRPYDEHFTLGVESPAPLPWTEPGLNPGLDPADDSPSWSAGTGTYAALNAGDTQVAVLARGLASNVVASPGDQDCCTESECGPPPPEEDPDFMLTGCDPLDESTWGEAGCPCRAIETSHVAVEQCSLAGGGVNQNELCEPIHPDGGRFDKYCTDGTGQMGNAVVCAETNLGNHICRECGAEGTFGCPCNEIDCEAEDLSCWGQDFANPGPDLSIGRCWDPAAPPDWVCLEVCDRISFYDNAETAVCVGPHLGSEWANGSPYNFTNGALHGHPAYCTTIGCSDPDNQNPVSAGWCEESMPGFVCSAPDICAKQCLLSEDCYSQGYPDWYGCAPNGVDLCLPLNVCNVKPEVCG